MHGTRVGNRRRWKSVANEGFLVCALLGCVLFLLYLVLALFDQRQTVTSSPSAHDRFIIRTRQSSFRFLEPVEKFTTLALVGPSLGQPAVLQAVERAVARVTEQGTSEGSPKRRRSFVITLFVVIQNPFAIEVGPSRNREHNGENADGMSAMDGLRYWYRARVLRPEFGGRTAFHPRRWMEELRRPPEQLDITINSGIATPLIGTHEPPTYTFRFLRSLAEAAPPTYNGTWSWSAATSCLSEGRMCGRDSHALHSEYIWWRSGAMLSGRRLNRWLEEAILHFRKTWSYDPSVFVSPFDEWTISYVNAISNLFRSRSSTSIPGLQTAAFQANKLYALCKGEIHLQPYAGRKSDTEYCHGRYDIYDGPRIQVPELDEEIDPEVLEGRLVTQITSHLAKYSDRTFLTISEYLQMRRQGVSREFWPPYGTLYRNFRDETVQVELDDSPCSQRRGWWHRRKRITLNPGQSFFHSCVPDLSDQALAAEEHVGHPRGIALDGTGLLSESL
jgi:hypothetical protein